jgi:hypothetical protein
MRCAQRSFRRHAFRLALCALAGALVCIALRPWIPATDEGRLGAGEEAVASTSRTSRQAGALAASIPDASASTPVRRLPALAPAAPPRPGSTLAVMVEQGDEGVPVAGARIQATLRIGARREALGSSIADAAGLAIVALPPLARMDHGRAAVRLLVTASGCLAAERELSCEDGVPRESIVHLEPGGACTGRVVDADGRPVAGAELDLRALEHAAEGVDVDLNWNMTTSDENGAFTLPVAGTARYALIARAEGKGVASRTGLFMRAFEHTHAGDLVLAAFGRLHGRLADPAGRPLGGVPLTARAADREPDSEHDQAATDGDGEPSPVVALPSRGDVEASVTTAADGSFACVGLREDLRYAITGIDGIELEGAWSCGPDPIRLVCTQPLLRVRVRDEQRRPLDGLSVGLYPLPRAPQIAPRTASTRGESAVAWFAVQAARSYAAVTAVAGGFTVVRTTEVPSEIGVTELDLTIVAARSAVRHHFMALDEKGAPLDGMPLVLRDAVTQTEITPIVRDSDGVCRDALPPGRWVLCAEPVSAHGDPSMRYRRCVAREIEVPAHVAGSFEITVPLYGAASFRVTSPSMNPPAVPGEIAISMLRGSYAPIPVGLDRSSTPSCGDHSALTTHAHSGLLEPGRWRVEMRGDRFLVYSETVDIVPGETTRVEIALQPR